MPYRVNDRDIYKVAAERGQVVVTPHPNELLIDIDTASDQYVLEAMLALLNQHGISARITERTRSLHGGRHFYVKVDIGRPLTDMERVAFQAALGSDRKRELLGILRALGLLTAAHVSVFFESPEDARALANREGAHEEVAA